MKKKILGNTLTVYYSKVIPKILIQFLLLYKKCNKFTFIIFTVF